MKTVRQRAATTFAWIGLLLAAASGIVEVLAGVGTRLGGWHYGTGIQIVSWSAWTALAAAAVALVATLLTIRSGARGTLLLGLGALALSLVAAGPPVYLYRQAMRLPLIHDISTDTENPPRFVAVLPMRANAENSTEYLPAVAAKQKSGYPDIAPAMLGVPASKAMLLAEQVVRSMGWEIVAVAPDDMRIEATATTLLFGFKDDVVIRVAQQGSGSRVDVRSLSRVGASDIGANAARIRTFLAKLKAEQARG